MRKSLRIRFTTILISLAIVPLIILGIFLAQRSFTTLSEQAISLQREVALRVANDVDTFIRTREDELLLLAKTQGLQQADEEGKIRALSGLLASQEAYQYLVLINGNGFEELLVTQVGTVIQNEENHTGLSEFEKPKAGGETYFSPVQFDEETGEPFMVLSTPLYDIRSGEFDGVLAAQIRFRPIWDLMSNAQVPGSGIVYVTNIENEVVAHRDSSIVLQAIKVALPEEDGFYPGLENDSAAIAIVRNAYGTVSLFTVAELSTDEAVALAISNFWLTVAITVVTLFLAVVVSIFAARQIVGPIENMADTAQAISAGDLSQRVSIVREDEIGSLATAFNQMTTQLQGFIGSLEERVQQRTQALKTSTEVSRRLSTILDTSELVQEVVKQIRDAFNYYHAHIYLVDETGENLLMAGGTGEAGQTMLARGHKLNMGQGLVGRAAVSNEPVLVPDVSQEVGWLPNPLLPDTKAEAAIPITLGDQVLGVLDVQHDIVGGLDEESVALLQSVANQVAIALQNARQYQQTQESEMRSRTILDAVNAPLLISRVSDGKLLYANDGLANVVRLPLDELLEKGTPNFYVDMADRQAVVGQIQKEGGVTNYELRLRRSDGEIFWALLSARLIKFADDVAIFTTLLDITERKESEGLLAKQANELSTVALVSTTAATIRDPEVLLQEVVDLTKTNFNLYHAHIHLLNDSKDTLVLTAGAGDIGRQMVTEGRRIPLAATGSLVATTARTKQGGIRNYDSAGEGFMPHPLLADTRCEMAVPVILGEDVLGVLDVRSDQIDYFSDADMQTYSTLAAQIAVALQNARSFARSEQALKELGELSRRLTREGWESYLEQTEHELSFAYDLHHVVKGKRENSGGKITDSALNQPINVLGEPVGQISVSKPQLLSDEAAEIMAAVTERLSAHLENLRLAQQTQSALNETQRRTEELAILNEMSQTLTAQTTVNGVFQTVYDYLSRLMDTTNFFTVTYDEERDEVAFVLTAVADELRWHTEKRQAGHGVTEYVIRQQQPLLIPENVGEQLTELGIDGYGNMPQSWLGVPIILGNRVLGIIGLESYTTPRLYSEDHLNLVTAVANQAAIAIESTRLLESTTALAEEEKILRQITTRVSTAVDAESILRAAAEEIGRALGLEGDIVVEGVGTNGSVINANGNRDK